MPWSSGDALTPTNLNANIGGPFINAADADYGAAADGTTDDTSAITTAASGNTGIVVIPPNAVYSVGSLVANPVVTYLDSSMRTDSIHDGRSVRFISVRDLDDVDVASGERPRHFWSVLEIEGSTASVTTARADGNLLITTVGRRVAPAASDGSGLEQVIGTGLYFEHRSDVTIGTRVYGAEVAATVYGKGNVNTARGMHGVAQIATPGRGSQVGVAGSGTIGSAIGVEGSAKITGSAVTGRITSSGVGVQGSVQHDAGGYWPTAYIFRGVANIPGYVVSGSTLIGTLYGSDQTYVLSSSSATITNLYGQYIRDPGSQGNVINAYGLVVDAMSVGSNNKTAWFVGDVHIQRGQSLVVDSGSGDWDETVDERARVVYNSATDAVEFYNRATGADPVLSLVSSHIRLPSPAAAGPAGDAAGTKGEMLWTAESGATWLYVCTSTNSWHRAALSPF